MHGAESADRNRPLDPMSAYPMALYNQTARYPRDTDLSGVRGGRVDRVYNVASRTPTATIYTVGSTAVSVDRSKSPAEAFRLC